MHLKKKISNTIVGTAIFTVLVTAVTLTVLFSNYTKQTLLQQFKSKSMLVLGEKRNDLIKYFNNVHTQAQLLSNNIIIKNALKEFTAAYNSPNSLNQENANYSRSVIEHYVKSFANEYKILNGVEINNEHLLRMLNLMDDKAFNLQYSYILENPFPIRQKFKFEKANNNSLYDEVHEKYHTQLVNLSEVGMYFNLLLVDAKTSNVVYAVEKKFDFATSILHGPFAHTRLAQAYKKIIDSTDKDDYYITDFSSYIPSYGLPSMFVATPIVENGVKIGALILEISIDLVNNIMSNAHKIEDQFAMPVEDVYIVGNDLKLRSTRSAFWQNQEQYLKAMIKSQNLTVEEAKIANVRGSETNLTKLDNVAIRKSLEGKNGILEIENDGQKELFAFMPLQIQDINWAIVTNVDMRAFSKISWILFKKFTLYSIIVGIILFGVFSIFGLIIAHDIIMPINKLSDILGLIVETREINKRIRFDYQNETGNLINNINKLLEAVEAGAFISKGNKNEYGLLDDELKDLDASIAEMYNFDNAYDQTSMESKVPDKLTSADDMMSRLEQISKKFKKIQSESKKISDW